MTLAARPMPPKDGGDVPPPAAGYVSATKFVTIPLPRGLFERLAVEAEAAGVDLFRLVGHYCAVGAGHPTAYPLPAVVRPPEPEPAVDPRAEMRAAFAQVGARRFGPPHAAKTVEPDPAATRERLMVMRERLGWSQREAARRIGVSRGMLSDLESGRRKSPGVLTRCVAHLVGAGGER